MFQKRKIIKNVELILSLLLTVGILGACDTSKKDSKTAAGVSATQRTEDTESPANTKDSKEIETLTVMVWDRGTAAPGTTQENNALVDWIKEQVLENCNVDVNFMSVPRSDSDGKLNVMMAGGSAPDIVFTYDQSIYTNYAANGGLADLTEAYAVYGTQIQEVSGDIQYMGKYEESQYAIMKQRSGSIGRHITYIRTDWLKTLGMDIPTTKEELFDVLYAFKDQNPGNVSNVIPWAMGGSTDSGRYYLNFVGSYVDPQAEREAYIYSEEYKIFADGAIDGILKLNELYNDGIISQDFITDTSNDMFKQDVNIGNAGFFLADTTNPGYGANEVLQTNVEGGEFTPITCLELSDGSYCTPAEPLYGMFVMVPKTSENKVNAAVKYLNWLVNPEVAENIAYSPAHETSENGIPIWLTQEELAEHGYPGNAPDYNIMNNKYEYATSKDSNVASLLENDKWGGTQEFYENAYDVFYEDGHYLFPTFPAIIDAETQYGANIKTLAVEYVYKLICCSPDQFGSLQAAEYDKLVAAGLEKILEERTEYYDNIAAN